MERVLGRTMHRVTQAVLVEGMSMETIAAQLFNRAGEVSTKYYGRLFRDALEWRDILRHARLAPHLVP